MLNARWAQTADLMHEDMKSEVVADWQGMGHQSEAFNRMIWPITNVSYASPKHSILLVMHLFLNDILLRST